MCKRLIAMLLVLILCFGGLSACGSSSEETTETTETEETAEETTEEAVEEEETAEAAEETAEAEEELETEEAVEEEPEEAAEEAAAEEQTAETAAEEEEETLQLTSVELPLFEEPVTLTYWTSLPFFMESIVTDMGEDLYQLSQLQEECNFELEVTSVNSMAESEQFALMVAAGDYCDILSGMANYTNGYDAAISDEVIIDLYDLVQEYAPNYWYYVNSSDDIRAALITDEGALPTVATIYKEAGCENGGLIYRSDWLEELGLDVPETYEELHDFIQLCNETYGSEGIAISGSGNGVSIAGTITQLSYGYDFAIGNYNVVDGEVVYSFLNDSCYDYLEMMAAWYADGTIPQDFYDFETDEGDTGIPNGKYAVSIATAANITTIAGYADEGAEYELSPLNAPTDGSGEQLHYRWTDDYSQIKRRDAWAVSVNCEHPEYVLQIVNYLFSEEGQLFFNYGTEGLTFEYDEEGNPGFTELITNNPDYAEMYAQFLYVATVASEYMPGVMDVTASYYYFGDSEWEIFNTFRDCDADGTWNMPTAVSLNEEESIEYAQYSTDVETYISTEFLRFITVDGYLTEESFEEFRQNIISMGGERMEELYQAAYERYLEKLA